jgi:hypothetical protein
VGDPPAPKNPRVNEQAMGTTKRCPICAEMVQADALVCRYCSYDFRTGKTPGSGLANVNGVGVASLVVAILSFIALPLAPLSLAGGIVALVLGYRSRKQVDRSQGREGGRGLAVAGIVLGWIVVLAAVLILVLLVGVLVMVPFEQGSESLVPE